jgi:ribosomal protein S18 acetylase RimI-like enzyme
MTRAIRPAAAADAARLCDIQMDAWRSEYPHDTDPEAWLDADGFDRAAREANMVWLLTAPTTRKFLVAQADAEVVGFITVGDSRDDDRPGETELSSIYFAPASHGTGFARELLDGALGTQPAHLWVAEENGRARAFYAKAGFVTDGERRDNDTLFDQPEIRMARGEFATAPS